MGACRKVSEPLPFLAMSLAVVALYYVLKFPAWRRSVLLLANLVFLATFFPTLQTAIPFAVFLIAGYLGLCLIRRRPRVAFLPVVIATIAAFVWLKKYTFVPAGLTLHFVYVTVGLSYILFRVLHLMIDTSSGALEQGVGFLSYFNYTASFTTLVSGPIQLYGDWVKTEDPAARPPLTAERALEAMERIVRGLFKTNVLALLLSALQSRMLDLVAAPAPVNQKIIPGALSLVLYPLFIYCNFSGYIDIVIGVGKLLGVTLPENFIRPFSADNIMDFWGSRWHITLSHWLRAYVFNPLLVGLTRRFPSERSAPVLAVVSFFVTFFLIGAWHGQTSEFIFYGFLLGLGVSVNKIYQIAMTRQLGRKRYNALCRNGSYVALSRGLTFSWVTFTTIWFWANWHQIRGIASALAPRMLLVWILIFAGSTVILAAWEKVRLGVDSAVGAAHPVYSQCLRTALNTAAIVILIAIGILMNRPAPDIVYKAF
jgi:D-alanyl-lipoteichoic acid acyltransferase DltB (MBOAT superfamily)